MFVPYYMLFRSRTTTVTAYAIKRISYPGQPVGDMELDSVYTMHNNDTLETRASVQRMAMEYVLEINAPIFAEHFAGQEFWRQYDRTTREAKIVLAPDYDVAGVDFSKVQLLQRDWKYAYWSDGLMTHSYALDTPLGGALSKAGRLLLHQQWHDEGHSTPRWMWPALADVRRFHVVPDFANYDVPGQAVTLLRYYMIYDRTHRMVDWLSDYVEGIKSVSALALRGATASLSGDYDTLIAYRLVQHGANSYGYRSTWLWLRDQAFRLYRDACHEMAATSLEDWA